MTDKELQDLLYRQFYEAVDKARMVINYTRFAIHRFDPTLTFDLRGQCLGMAHGTSKVRVNMEVARRLGEGYKNTMIHEVAHCAVDYIRLYEKYHPLLKGDMKSSHGPAWKNVMAAMGVSKQDILRCASEEEMKLLAGMRANPYVYTYTCRCPGKVWKFSQRRHNNTQIRKIFYTCRSCKARLEFKPE